MEEKIRLKMLGELIEAIQLNNLENRAGKCTDLAHLYAHFFTKRGKLVTDELGVDKALDCLFCNVHKFEGFDLSDAFRVEVHSH